MLARATAALALTLLVAQVPAIGAEATPQVRIAILDTGILAAHPEFASGQVLRWADHAGNLQDPGDLDGHGTAVASVAAGLTLGESPGTPLLVGRVCSAEACNTGTVRAGLAWALEHGATVINLSLGTEVPIPDLLAGLEDLLAEARSRDVLVTVAAGNGVANLGLVPFPSELHAPAGSSHVLVVGSARESGAAHLGHATDPEVTQVGVDVPVARGGFPRYGTMSGTSFAAPNAAGIAAEVQKAWIARTGELPDVDVLEDLLKFTARDTGASPIQEGYGFLDKGAALAQAGQGPATAPCERAPPGPDPPGRRCLDQLYVETVQGTVRSVW